MPVQEQDHTKDLSGALSPELPLRAVDLERIAVDLVAYHARFAPLFARQEQRDWAEVYPRGLLVADVPRKNVEAVAVRLLGAADGADRRVRALQHFVGRGPGMTTPSLRSINGSSRRRWATRTAC